VAGITKDLTDGGVYVLVKEKAHGGRLGARLLRMNLDDVLHP
jgi:hypothetical protein